MFDQRHRPSAITTRKIPAVTHNLFKTGRARDACRADHAGRIWLSTVFRLSDPEETDVAMRTYHIQIRQRQPASLAVGYQPMQRCLLLGTIDGDKDFAKLVHRKLHHICKRHSAFTLTPFRITQAWEKSRFTDPFMREDLMDYGIMIDTLECGVNWAQMGEVHRQVRAFVRNAPGPCA